MMRLRPSPDAPKRAETKGMSRSSMARISALTALQISALLSLGAVSTVAPVKQPTAYARNVHGAYNTSYTPNPDLDIETIMANLPTPESVGRFYQKHAKYERDSFPFEFANEYRKSPEEFQKAGWKGCCNNFAEFSCEWGAAHGHTMYLVPLWPDGWHQKAHESYHLFAVMCIENDKEYIIFDNKRVIPWEGTIESYVDKEWPEFSIPPIGGKVEWVRTQPNVLSRMFHQIGFNETEMKEVRKSDVEPRSVYVASNMH